MFWVEKRRRTIIEMKRTISCGKQKNFVITQITFNEKVNGAHRPKQQQQQLRRSQNGSGMSIFHV